MDALRALARRGLYWLLLIALAMPVAQASATRHALSHADAAAGNESAPHDRAAHHGQCDYCVAAVVLASSAPPPGLIIPAAPATSRPGARATLATPAGRTPALAYRSRAPPPASR